MESLLINVNEEIIIPQFGRFSKGPETIKVIEIKKDLNIKGEQDNIYCFDNGLKLCTHDLQKNIELWNSRR